MIEKKVTVINKSGLHARPASMLVKQAGRFKARINIKKAEKNYDAKSILGILSAGISCGTEITLICDGEDEAEAIKSLTELIEAGLGE